MPLAHAEGCDMGVEPLNQRGATMETGFETEFNWRFKKDAWAAYLLAVVNGLIHHHSNILNYSAWLPKFLPPGYRTGPAITGRSISPIET